MRGGGCFAPWCTVRAFVDGTWVTKQLSAVVAGELLQVAGGGCARVRCVVVSPCEDDGAELRRCATCVKVAQTSHIVIA